MSSGPPAWTEVMKRSEPKIHLRRCNDGVHRVWVTKWALTPTGVLYTDGVYDYGTGERYSADGIKFKMGDPNVYQSTYYAYGNDWHLDYNEAYKRVEQMQKNKLASLEKARKRVENFDYASIPR